MNPLLRRGLIALAAIAAVIFGSFLRRDAMARYLASRTLEDVYYLPPPDWIAVLSLGHREAAASAIYPIALVYFGRSFGTDVPAGYAIEYSKAMLELDPDFRSVYRFAPTSILYRSERPTPEEIEEVAEIVREGARRFPRDGELAWNAGATLAYELGQFVSKEEAKRFDDEAQPYFARAVELGAAPEWMALSTASKLSELGKTERAVEQLERVLPMIDDEPTRLAVIARLTELRAEADHRGLVHALDALLERHAAEFPFVPLDFYPILGPRELIEPLPLDLLALLDDERAAAPPR